MVDIIININNINIIIPHFGFSCLAKLRKSVRYEDNSNFNSNLILT